MYFEVERAHVHNPADEIFLQKILLPLHLWIDVDLTDYIPDFHSDF